MKELIEELKVKVIEQLNMEDIEPSEIGDDEPLFNEGLGLDSIDALELIVLLERDYGVKVPSAQEGKAVLFSISSMAKYINENK